MKGASRLGMIKFVLLLVSAANAEFGGQVPLEDIPDDHAVLAALYAPLIYFDQQAHQGRCLPDNAEDHYDRCVSETGCVFLCNNDKESIENNEISLYYQISDCDDGVSIVYWIWYGQQYACMLRDLGAHEGDWERVAVKLDTSRNPKYVKWHQHSGHYSMTWEDAPKTGTHPHAYTGRDSHGSYHNACSRILCFWCQNYCGGSCLYFDDFRNNRDGVGAVMESWNNLQHLTTLGDDAQPWMSATDLDWGVAHPIGRTIDLCDLSGCDGLACRRNGITGKFSG